MSNFGQTNELYSSQHDSHQDQGHHSAVMVQNIPSDLLDDVNHRLGRANGNIYRRKPEVAGIHDGELLVRLKKKRFILLDYSPREGITKQCDTQGCTKTARPRLVFDSDPDEPASLYLRSGLCFTCQRNVNEKRRSNRKSSDSGAANKPWTFPQIASPKSGVQGDGHQSKLSGNKRSHEQSYYQARSYSDAIVIEGSVLGARPADEHYTYAEIGVELQHLTRHLVTECDAIVAETAKGKHQATLQPSRMAAAQGAGFRAALPGLRKETRETLESKYQQAFSFAKKAVFQLSQWKSSWENALADTEAFNGSNSSGRRQGSSRSSLLRRQTPNDSRQYFQEGLSKSDAETETYAV